VSDAARRQVENALDAVAEEAVDAMMKSLRENGVSIVPGVPFTDRALDKVRDVINGELHARFG